MNTFDFTLSIDRLIEDLDEIDAVYARHDDISMFNSQGTTRITFHRESATLDDAIRSSVSDVQSFGYKVTQIEVEPECVGAN